MGTKPTGEQASRVSKKLQEISGQLLLTGGYPYDLNLLDSALQTIIEGRFSCFGENVESPLQEGSLFFVVQAGSGSDERKIEATPSKLTSQCFSNDGIFNRDNTIDQWLSEGQDGGTEGAFSVIESKACATFASMFVKLLSLKTDDPEAISKLLHHKGLMWTLPEIESLVISEIGAAKKGLSSDGRNNFFPVMNDERVAHLIHLCIEGKKWDVDIYRPDEDRHWEEGSRLFLPVSDVTGARLKL